MIELRSESLVAVIDPDYGADILSLRALPGDREVLWSTPWRKRADAIIAGAPGWAHEPESVNLERYRGGWQTLAPNAGPARTVHGAHVGFHGEVSRSAWDVASATDDSASLSLELISLPLRIEREVQVIGSTLTLSDRIANLSDQPLEFDYCQHPAFGGDLLDGECVITTGARRFVSDPGFEGMLPSGQVSVWPSALTRSGEALDLTHLPGPGVRRKVFGWLEDFAEPWYAICNPAQGLSVRVDWDGSQLPYAWFWQELNDSRDFPWFRRARVQAIEPASTQTSGPDRRSVLGLQAGSATTIALSVTLGVSEPSTSLPDTSTP